MDARMRPPQGFWPVLASAVATAAALVVVVGTTHRVTWYATALLLVACALAIWSWVLLLPSVVHRLRPSSYEHKSTAGERVCLAVLLAMLAGCVITGRTGPWWVSLGLLAAMVAGWLLLRRRQRQRIRQLRA